MEYENAGIRHIAIRKKDIDHYDDFDVMHGDKYSSDDSDDSDQSKNSDSEEDKSDNKDRSDEETFIVSPRHTSSSEDEEDADQMDLTTLMTAVDDIKLNIKDKENDYIKKKKALSIRESKFNLDTKIDSPRSRPSTSSMIETRSSISRTRTRPVSAPVSKPHNVHRLNISFSNDQVRKIDLENQRLLKQIIKNKTKPRNAFVSQLPKRFVSASAINRARQQQAIEEENLRFLKRLQAVKPTQSLSKNNLLKEHRNEERTGRRSRINRPASAPARKRPTSFNY